MKIFKFLKNHKLNVLIAFVLLFIQANCELTLPTLMSEIVDTGISRGGIDSVVANKLTDDAVGELKLFLTPEEGEKLEAAYGAPDDHGVRAFEGTARQKEELEGFLGAAEMLAFQMKEGIPVEDLASSSSKNKSADDAPQTDPVSQAQASAVMQKLGDTLDLDDVQDLIHAGVVSPDSLVAARDAMVDKLGEDGAAMIEARAVEFVKAAYQDAGVDVAAVQTSYLMRTGATMLGYALMGALCAICAALNASKTAAKIARDLRHDLYERVLSFSPAETGKFSAASLITRGTNDIQQIQMVLVMCMRMVLFAPCMGIGAIARVVSYGNTGLQWVVIVAVCGISVIVGVLMGLTLPRFRRMQSLVDKNNLIAREILTGIMPVRAFGRSQYEEQRYDAANRDLTKTYIFTNRAMSFMMPTMLIVMNLASVAIVWFGAHGIDAGSLQVGDLMAYMNYTIQVIMSFMVITMISVMLPRADVAAERVQEVLATHTSIVDPAQDGAGSHPLAEDGSVLPWRGELAFNDVSFVYPGSDTPTIEHVSFTVRPGQTVGIIGSTGVGKSTLVQLIPRLFDVTTGSVTLDGIDIKSIGLRELRSQIGYVPQKGMLFSGTIEDNIKYGDPSMNDEAMVEAAGIAQASEFIDAKPEAYASGVAQGGTNVSGGQRQRLAIARALAIRPKVLVFDDSFSALDYKTDAALRDALVHSASDSSVVIVGQRIATIMHADEILVLDDGRVVGQGKHEELLRGCPEYLEIAKSQLSAKELGLDEEAASQVVTGQVNDVKEGGER